MAALALVALSVTLGLQIFRVHFPLAFDLGEGIGFIKAGLTTVAVFGVAPLLAEPARKLLGPRNALVAALGGAALGRLLIQLVHPVPLWLTTASTVLVLVAWTLELISLRGRGREGSGQFMLALLLGLSLDTALRAIFRTWDYAWQDGMVPLLLALATAVAIGALLAVSGQRLAAAEHPRGGALALVLLGPFLMLQALFLQSPAFAASQSDISLPAAAGVILIGNALAITVAAWGGVQRVGPIGTGAAGIGLVVAAVAIRQADGPLIALVLILAQPLAAELLAAALGRDERTATPWVTSLGVGGGSLLFLALLVAYQIHYEDPLPFSNAVLPPVAGILLAWGGYRGGAGGGVLREGARADWLLAAVPLLLLVAPAVVRIAAPVKLRTHAEGGSFRLVDYNLHMGVNTEGQVVLEEQALAIEAQHPDVVVLQEVSRGWALDGMTDVAAWMSARLEMPYVYGPAADEQFGNAILSRFPIVRWRSGKLPRAEGTMTRGYVWAEIEIGKDRVVNVVDTHLQHNDESTQTRLKQIDALFRVLPGTPSRTIVAGDMNSYPDSDEFQRFTGAGFISAQDAIGDPDEPTSWQDDTRIDYVFGTPDLEFSRLELPFTKASDHLPLAVTISLP